MSIARRSFLRVTTGLGVFGSVPQALRGLVRLSAAREPPPASLGQGGYGELVPSAGCPELALPRGFTVARFGVSGEPMSDGAATPDRHDGMAAFPLPDGTVRLIRNHEISTRAAFGDLAKAYDPLGGGGTTTLDVAIGRGGAVRLVRDFVSLGGTIINCAGGPTPWGSWVSCEESVWGPEHGYERPHGYVFEVPAAAAEQVVAVPLPALGRFVHEAVAVDPRGGMVYLTEDAPAGGDYPGAGFYRFIPRVPGRLASGGRLQALAVRDRPNHVTYQGQRAGTTLPAVWVDIPEPDPPTAEQDPLAVLRQGLERGAATFQRLEGCWFGNGRVFFNATSGGDAGRGQVWQYRPRGPERGDLTLVFESPGPEVLNGPDNITVSPRGRGLLVAEDNGHAVHLRGVTPEGGVFTFARNLEDTREFAGVCFSPDGETLFVNLQGNGAGRAATYAIRGPWRRGVL